ncbi:MAG: peptide chain release factor N(5)-glutamine methyltransferase [Deltaproteobacteria bacterium]|nr:peptide chain release factor N(5)-glutamine methyltransferase [Deltaproteobacteria bacterium]
MRETLKEAIRELEAAGCETPRLDAEVLLAHALGCERHEIYLGPGTRDQGLGTEKKFKLFEDYIERRKNREPAAYITGTKEFWSLPIKVTPDVLIPRPETETLVNAALEKVPGPWSLVPGPFILDLCTGSGCVAAALAKELPDARFVVSDISPRALTVARGNLKFAEGRVAFIQSDLFENITGPFDLIVSNPPYVASKDWEGLQPEIKNFEPRLALDGGTDGLDFIRKILQDAPRCLKSNGWLILENGSEIKTWNALSLKVKNPFTEKSKSAEPRTPSSL